MSCYLLWNFNKQCKIPVFREMSQESPKCEYSDCRNAGVTASQCTECDKYFCDEHSEAHITSTH